MTYLKLFQALLRVIELFNPPPLESMSFIQKCGQVLRLTGTLVLGCIAFAFFGTLTLLLLEAWEFFLCLTVSGLCAYLTVQVSKFDYSTFGRTVPLG